MNFALISAVAVVAGSALGGVTSLASTLLGQRSQLRAQQVAGQTAKLETLYGDFIDEASRLLAHALDHNGPQPSDFVGVYAKIGKMRFLSSEAVIASGENVVRSIVETYLEPNRDLAQIRSGMERGALDPLREFSNACRAELQYLKLPSSK
ncbi:hypothetical protein [Bradyrhizobium sp. RDM4]|uniref:hypothetical protein n=1 Tax=Bradyrhizobium sp. RDM4 TaxID=3378765 RepID=UPI0038FC884E